MTIRAMRTWTLLAAATLTVLQPASPAKAEVSGMVHELSNPKAPRSEWQRKPLANAYVVITWWITVPAPGHATSSCLHAEIARSNANGEYVIEGPGLLTGGVARASLMAYAPGMDRVDWPLAGRPEALREVSLARSTAAPDERLSLMLIYDMAGCSNREMHDPRGLMRAYREALAAEAKALQPSTDAGKRIQQSLRARAEPPPPPEIRVLRGEDAPRPAAATPR
jgi:hypothetical protein